MLYIYMQKHIFKGSNNDIQAEQKDDRTEYAVWEDDDNEEEENKGQIESIFYINARQQWIHWYIAVQLMLMYLWVF